MKGINPKIKRKRWSFFEDLVLGISLTKIYGEKKWSKAANHLPGRTDIQCRERWCNILDPNLKEAEWTEDEDCKLLNLYDKFGKKWSLIANEFGNRTDNTCWRRWKFLFGVDKENSKKKSESKKKSKKLFNVFVPGRIEAPKEEEKIKEEEVKHLNQIGNASNSKEIPQNIKEEPQEEEIFEKKKPKAEKKNLPKKQQKEEEEFSDPLLDSESEENEEGEEEED